MACRASPGQRPTCGRKPGRSTASAANSTPSGPRPPRRKRRSSLTRRTSAGTNGGGWRKSPNTLSPLAQRDLDELWTNLRTLQQGLDPTNPRRGDLTVYAGRIESLRQSRLTNSTSNIPGIFWLILVIFVAVASFLSGRETPKGFGLQVNMIHMAALGLAVGLVIVLDNPFRGETSIDSAIIGQALSP